MESAVTHLDMQRRSWEQLHDCSEKWYMFIVRARNADHCRGHRICRQLSRRLEQLWDHSPPVEGTREQAICGVVLVAQGLKYNGTVSVHHNFPLPGSSNSPASASRAWPLNPIFNYKKSFSGFEALFVFCKS
ncbi:hypothetical protein AAY473_011326 [Plecturocebus cupreus]